MVIAVRDDDWYEREYNPRVTVAETAALLAAWPVRSAAVLGRRRPTAADVAYGPHPREILDFHRAAGARGVLVFVHGGYWRAFTKAETAFLLDGFLDQGVSVALVNYPLCPEVTIAAIAASVRRAFAVLYTDLLDDAERAGVVVSGHSAGGYLAADLMTVDWTAVGLPADPIHLVLPISGLFELEPLVRTSMNVALGLDGDTARDWSLVERTPRVRAALALAVGGDETAEFHRQSAALAAAWSGRTPRLISVPSANHFTVLDSLATPGALLNTLALEGVRLG